MNELDKIISFYRDCYQHDLKGIRVTNFISRASSKRLTPTDNEFFHSAIDKIHVESEWASSVEKTLLLNHKEKALYAGTFFIKGDKSVLGKTSTSYVPLYIHELELIQIEKVYFIQISNTYLNPDFTEMLNSMDNQLGFNLDIIEQKLPSDPFGFEHLLEIENFFEKYCPKWNINELFNYHDQKFDFSKHFEVLKKLETGTKTVSSSLIIGIFNKPKGSLGVLNELTILQNKAKDAPLLNQFFGLSNIDFSDVKFRETYIPASLSKPQLSTIFKSDAYPISMILGPPGTGKSFTIASLALDAICHEKSVLIVSKNSQATRVIADIIENKFGIKGKLVKADNQRYKRGLSSRLSKMITWVRSKELDNWGTLSSIDMLQWDIKLAIKSIITVEKKEIEWGKFYHQNRKGFFSLFRDKWIQYQKSRTDLTWKLNNSLISKNRQKNAAIKKHIKKELEKKLHYALKVHRNDFTELVEVLEEPNFTKLSEKIHTFNFNLILKALPVWLTTTKQISNHLPLKKRIFDLVIVDEASQCDIASLIPAIYRGKKLVVVGDPQQLNHVSFLSDKKQKDLRLKYQLDDTLPDYRTESTIDWTNKLLKSQNQVTFLNDHYRSKPAIIRFSNEKFYNDQLSILRSHPIKDGQESVILNKVMGVRDKKGFNLIEAEAIIDQIKSLISQYQSVDNKMAPTIGITSPISSQVSYLKSLINKEFEYNVIKKHNILVGTPFHFQGEERDIMFISFTIDSDAHYGSINYLNREDVFNVLVTRARNMQYLFTSIESNQLPKSSLLREYLEYDHEYREVTPSKDIYDNFQQEMVQYLSNSGYNEIYTSFTVSGVQIDLTIVHNEQYYCIDLIGYPGEFEAQFSARNIEILNRMEVPVYFIPYSSWVLNTERTKRDLLNFLKNQRN
ncbi:MAG: DEAD/DEAH box helicase [Balneolaceae bacterium]